MRWRAVSRVMALGAVYDLAFGVAILAAPAAAASLLSIELPADPFYLRLNGVFLLLLAALYALPAAAPERYHLVAPVSAGGRAVGAAVFALAWREGRPTTFLVLGAADLALGAITLLLWRRARRQTPSA